MMFDFGTGLALIRDTLLFQPGTTELLRLGGAAISLAFGVLFAAGLSEAIGESVVLFVNRVSPRRFAISLVISAIIFAFTYLFFALSVYVVARYALASEAPFSFIAGMVALGQAPRLFGFLVFLPYLGLPLSVLLWIWSIGATVLSVAEGLELAPWEAVLAVAVGALLLITLQRTIGRPLLLLARVARRQAAGVKLVTDVRGLRDLIDDAPDEGLAPPKPARRRRGGQT
ncbi:MAG TPA: hypothetical protein PLT07_03960 [Trueperaceae bacterium]|nr:hypothetical protein [Trueperaceae bacterium]